MLPGNRLCASVLSVELGDFCPRDLRRPFSFQRETSREPRRLFFAEQVLPAIENRVDLLRRSLECTCGAILFSDDGEVLHPIMDTLKRRLLHILRENLLSELIMLRRIDEAIDPRESRHRRV